MLVERTHSLFWRFVTFALSAAVASAGVGCGATIARDVEPGRDARGTEVAMTAGHPLAVSYTHLTLPTKA